VYIQDNQSSAEKRFGLNLMINMLSQNKNSEGQTFLHESVYHIAEILMITQKNKLLNLHHLMELIREYPRSDIPLEAKKIILKQLSDSYFDESPVKKTSSSVKSRHAEVEESEGSDSDKDTRQSRQAQSKKVIQTKSTDVLEFRELMDQLMSKTTESTVHDKVRDEQLLEKYMECLPKFDKGHIVAMVMHLLYPKEAMENQGRAISSIFQAIDVKTQGLIELPMASDTETRNQVGRLQASTALACLLRHFYGKDHSSIKKQVQMIQACFKRYPKSIQDPTRFKREVHTELAVYDSLWRFIRSRPTNERLIVTSVTCC